MAKYTLEEIMCGEKYNIESDVFMEVFRLVEQKVDAKMIREQLNTIYVKHTLLTAKKMIEEGDSISDIPEFEPLSLHEEGNNANT
ncbi:MAG: hypothetical protein K5768_05120 [Firmicutes bacterium]|nr:hypothetical protein [Bacillota bacterium]